MKVVSSLALALVFGAISASAAPKSAKSATLSPKASARGSGPKADALKKNEPSSATVKEGASIKEVTAGSSAAPAAQSATTVSAVAPAPKKFSVTWLMVNEYEMARITKYEDDPKANKDGDIVATQSIRLNYKVTPTTSARVAFESQNKWGQGIEDEDTKRKPFTWLDPYAQIASSNLATLPGNAKLSGFARAYPAITEDTKDLLYGVVRGGFTISKELGRLTLSLDNDSRWYGRRDLSLADDKGVMKVTKLAKYKNWLTANVDLGAGFSVYHATGTTNMIYNEDNGLRKDGESFLFVETAVEYAAASNISLSLGLNTEEARDLNKQSYAAYNPAQSSVFLLSSITY